jgi:phosphoglycolate phosphatase-like HAD superfamily hydrolase
VRALVESAEAVFFDFDGVIVDSHTVKTRAFAALYADDHPEIVEAVMAYHNAHGGMSRYKKFDHFERALLGREPSAGRIAELGERFAGAVVEAVVASPEIPGAGELLSALRRRETPCYVASGTPEEELRQIVKRRQLEGFFRAVRGSPAEKAEILAELCERHRHDVARCLMVGDAMTDYVAAQAVGMPFLGVVKQGHASPFPRGAKFVAALHLHAPVAT